jgi:WD40 repeat protein
MTSPSVPNAEAVAFDPEAAALISDWHHDTKLLCCRVDPTGSYVVAGGIDHQIQRWSIATGTKTSLTGHENWVRAIGFSTDGKMLYSGGYDGRLIAWPITDESPRPSSVIRAHQGWLRGLAVSSDGQRVATCGNDKLVKIWSIVDGQVANNELVHELEGHTQLPYCVQFVPGSHDLVSGDIVGTIHHWCGVDGHLVRTFDAAEIHNLIGDIAPFGGIISLAFSPDGGRLTATGLHRTSNAPAGNRRGVALSFCWKSGEKLLKQESIAKEFDGTMWRGLYHSTGTLVGVLEKEIGFWHQGEEDAFHLVTTPSDIFDCDLHPNQLDLYTAHFDGHVRCHRLATG